LLNLVPLAAISTRTAHAQTAQLGTLQSATVVLQEIQRMPGRSIPRGLLAKAKAVVIIPNMLKIGFIGAVRHGSGVAIVRNPNGTWGNPIFVSLTGGGVGFQVGVQATDVILVFMSPERVATMLAGRFTIGADAAAAAGPVGRQAAAATDLRFRAEILSYSRSRGLFVGVSLDGSVLSIDRQSNAIFYHVAQGDPGPIIAAEGLPLPPAASNLKMVLAMQSGAPVAGPPSAAGTFVPTPATGASPRASVPPAFPSSTAAPPATTRPSPRGPPPPALAPDPMGPPSGTPSQSPVTEPSVPVSPPTPRATAPAAQSLRPAAGGTATPNARPPSAPPAPTVSASGPSTLGHAPAPRWSAGTIRREDDIRTALLSMHDALAKRLDNRWRKYLALPAEVTGRADRPTPALLARTIRHFDTVATDPNYTIISDTPEFRRTRLLLKEYLAALSR